MTLGQTPRAPSVAPSGMRNVSKGDYGLGHKGDQIRDQVFYTADGDFVQGLDPALAEGKHIEETETTFWALTFWIPSPLLSFVGRMKRPDVRLAWREELVLVFLIALCNAIILFWIIAFGKLLCPNMDKAWAQDEVAGHMGEDDFWVSIK